MMRATPDVRWTLACFLPLCIAVVGWLVHVLVSQWVPHGDFGVAAIKTHDVFSSDPPLLGMPSTSSVAVPGNTAHHPGPILFYAMALPYRVTQGSAASLVVGSAAIILVLIWFSLRAGMAAYGRRGIIVTSIALAWTILEQGLHATLPWNPWPAQVATIGAIAAAWAVLRGRQIWWIGFIALSAVAAQAHLSLSPLMLGLGIFLLVSTVVDARRYGWSVEDRRQWIRASIVLLIVWAPPIIDQLIRETGNLTKILEYAQGTGGGTSWMLYASGAAIGLVGLAVAGITVTSRRPEAIFIVLVVALALAWWSTGRTNDSQSSPSYVDGPMVFLLSCAMAVPIVLLVRSWPRVMLTAAVMCGIFAAVAVEQLPMTRSYDNGRADANITRHAMQVANDLIHEADQSLPVEVRGRGHQAWAGIMPAVCSQFIAAGRDTYCKTGWTTGREGERRLPSHLDGVRNVVLIESGKDADRDQIAPGATIRELADLDAEAGLTVNRGEDWVAVSIHEESP